MNRFQQVYRTCILLRDKPLWNKFYVWANNINKLQLFTRRDQSNDLKLNCFLGGRLYKAICEHLDPRIFSFQFFSNWYTRWYMKLEWQYKIQIEITSSGKFCKRILLMHWWCSIQWINDSSIFHCHMEMEIDVFLELSKAFKKWFH